MNVRTKLIFCFVNCIIISEIIKLEQEWTLINQNFKELCSSLDWTNPDFSKFGSENKKNSTSHQIYWFL